MKAEDNMYPLYRDRYLPAMTRGKIDALPDKSWAPVIVATGAIEQHGPHLPVAVDALMGQIWLTRALAVLPEGANCYVAPPITIGKSNEHTGFPGTLTISKETLRAQLIAIARQVQVWGFRQFAVLNTHGGNTSVINYTIREIRSLFDLRADLLRPDMDLEVSEQESTFGFHAGEVETSWMLAAASRTVRPSEARSAFPANVDDPGELRPEAAPATFAWVTLDLSPHGIVGDATAATVAKGEEWLEHGAACYARAIAAVCEEGRKAAGIL